MPKTCGKKTPADLLDIVDNMSQPQLLIVGDSFSAVKNNSESWTCQFNDFNIINLSAAGCSEYRIFTQLKTTDLSCYDRIIVVHTSPNRIYINQNPLHIHSKMHYNCDLIYQDVKAQPSGKFRDHVVWWFENVFDLAHAQDMHTLLMDQIISKTPTAVHLSFFELEHPAVYNLHHIWKKYPGEVNHLSNKGNQQVAEFVRNKPKEVA